MRSALRCHEGSALRQRCTHHPLCAFRYRRYFTGAAGTPRIPRCIRCTNDLRRAVTLAPTRPTFHLGMKTTILPNSSRHNTTARRDVLPLRYRFSRATCRLPTTRYLPAPHRALTRAHLHYRTPRRYLRYLPRCTPVAEQFDYRLLHAMPRACNSCRWKNFGHVRYVPTYGWTFVAC